MAGAAGAEEEAWGEEDCGGSLDQRPLDVGKKTLGPNRVEDSGGEWRGV